jgi:hypothetical protein
MDNVLLGATGTGKTATTAWLAERLQRPMLVMMPNKLLAAQFANELRELLPNNAVEYFVSYYDYYQPEAYIAQSDTYIEKDSSINEEVERLRHSATWSLLTRRDVIVVATVSCIYGLGSAQEYLERMIGFKVGEEMPRDQLLRYGKHMVFSEDGALHVVWSDLDGMPRMCGINGSLVRRWQPMRIQRYEPGSPWGWREVHHLGGRAFLIGSHSQSVCLEEPARKILPGSNMEHSPNTHPYIMEFDVVNGVFSTRNHFDHTDDNRPDVDYPWLYPANLPAGNPCLAWSKAIWFTP